MVENRNGDNSSSVRASPTKLVAARNAANINSNNELARRIQRLEGKTKPQKSLVDRVFSGNPVRMSSISRVAKALNVENEWSLYMDEEEMAAAPISSDHNDTPEQPSDNSELKDNKVDATKKTETEKKAKTAVLLFPAVLFAVIICAGVLLWFYPQTKTLDLTPEQSVPETKIALADKVIAVLPIKGPRGDDITHSLQQILADSSAIIPGSSALYNGSTPNPLELVRSNKADLVISGETLQMGRHILLLLFVTEEQSTLQVLGDAFVTSTSKKHIESSLKAHFAALLKGVQSNSIISPKVLKSYLKGQSYLLHDRSETNILRALSEFESVVRLAPNFTKGHSSLCNALLQQSILSSDKNKLNEAQLHCDKANSLAPNSLNAITAQANLNRKKGKLDLAQKSFEKALEMDPNNISATIGLSELLMRRFLKNRDSALFQNIESMLAAAMKIEPNNWKIPFTLGRLFYFNSDRAKSIEHFTQALALDSNYQTLNNLATLEFCNANLTLAKKHYQQAFGLKPQELALLSNIATLHLYLGELDEALAIYKPQLKRLQQDGAERLYQVWGNIADVYRLKGQKEQAINAYRNALDTLEQEMAKGESNAQQQAARIALYLQLIELEPEKHSDQLLTSLKKELVQLENVADPVSLMHISLSWISLGEWDKAKPLIDKLGAICPGYVASPDLVYPDQKQESATNTH